MQYNIHPILVHFPIALLFIYSIIKIIPLKRWFPRIAWRDVERVLLLIGVIGAFAALSTGEIAEHFAIRNHKLVEMHAAFAATATWMYGLLLAGEIVLELNKTTFILRKNNLIATTLRVVEKVLCNRVLYILLAIVGLCTLAITGLLGGVITYGVNADPFAGIVLKVLGISL